MICDANGVPLRFMLSPGQASDIAHAQPLLDQVRIPGKPGRPRKRSRWLLADKGYDAEHLRHYCGRHRMQPVIPLRAMPRKPRPGLPRLFDRPKYRQRNIIERMSGWLKENRRIGTRYDKLAKSFAAMVTSAAACVVCGSTFRTKPRHHPVTWTATGEQRQPLLRMAVSNAEVLLATAQGWLCKFRRRSQPGARFYPLVQP